MVGAGERYTGVQRKRSKTEEFSGPVGRTDKLPPAQLHAAEQKDWHPVQD